MTQKRKVTIPAGTDWQDIVSILQAPFVYHEIATVTVGWPTRLRAVGHGHPSDVIGLGWIQGSGRLGLDTASDRPHPVRRVDADTLELVGHSSIGRGTYAGGAKIALLSVQTLTGATCRAQFKTDADADPLVTLTEASGITVASRSLTFRLTPAQSRLLEGKEGLAQVELTIGGLTSRPFQYQWSGTTEWTRE